MRRRAKRRAIDARKKTGLGLQTSRQVERACGAPAIVIVGAGPVGVRIAQELRRHAPDVPLVVFGAEPWRPYNRVGLTALIAGEKRFEDLVGDLHLPEKGVEAHYHSRVVAIDRAKKRVQDEHGRVQVYKKLVLALGARAHVPELPGVTLSGVYTLRELSDAERLVARRARSRHTVVLGGGPLGLECARGMRRHGTEVTVIDHNPRVMARCLDPEAALLVQGHLAALGIRVLPREIVERVLGEGRVVGVALKGGVVLTCDTVVIATGIRPETALARAAGLAVGRGIRVNDAMQTTDLDIYAVGECAEHRGNVYGLVAPGYEQAAVAARHLTGGDARYLGTAAALRLKVVGCAVASVGEVEQQGLSVREARYRDGKVYRKLIVERGRLRGAIAVGEWPEWPRVQEAVIARRRVWPWQLAGFRRRGALWPARQKGVADWPGTAVVCNCTGVTRARLGAALLAEPQASVAGLSKATGAGTVCGSCRPLLAEICGSRPEPVRGYRALLTASIAGLALLLPALVSPPIPYHASVQIEWQWDVLWRDPFYKQISGFTLLCLSLLALVLSARKRLSRFGAGDYAHWRLFHLLTGICTLAVLAMHTGLRAGSYLNAYLMWSFAAVFLVGTLAGTAIALEHRLSPSRGRTWRRTAVWLHLIAAWPLPALLGFHILKTYYF